MLPKRNFLSTRGEKTKNVRFYWLKMKYFHTKIFDAVKALITGRVTIECDSIPYEFHHIPMKKVLNWLLVESSLFIKPLRPWGLPTHLMIEPTSICNIKCVLCPVTEGLKRDSGYMDLELFKKAIDQIGDYVFLILLWDWGEPFLNPQIYDMIIYAKQRNIKIVSSTNGHIFAQRDYAERVVRSGIDSLIFAVDGITQQTYERYRQGGDMEKVMAGIKNVIEVRKILKLKTPLVNMRFIVAKHNEHEVPKLKTFAENIGVDLLTIRTLYPFDDGYSRATKTDGSEFIPKNPYYQRFAYIPETHSRIRRRRNPCKTLWNNPVIHWNGNVCPCTFDPHDKHVLGTLTKDTFKEIWFGASYRKFRLEFRRNYQSLDLCAECTNAFEGGACSTEDIVESHFFPNNKIIN